jgi:cation diffusion facilitator family transporter
MERFTRWTVSLVVPKGVRLDTDADRARVGKLEGWASIVVNVLLFLLKGALGLMAGSVALIADAFHTLSDCVTSIVVLFGFRMAEKPADDQHPFGHGRMENIAAIVIGVLLAVTALEILRVSVDRLLHPVTLHAADWVIATVAGTVVVKELMAQFSFRLGRMIESEALMADARHHRSDALSTVIVVAALIVAHWRLPWVDGAMGVCVALMIAWAAYESLRDSIGPLLGQPAPDRVFQEIDRIARDVPGVLGVHDIVVHRYGAMSVISLHIEVCATENAMRLHELSDQVEMKLDRRFHGHSVVHVDPINTDHPHYEEVRRMVAEIIESDPKIGSFHDLRLLGGEERFKVVFDITAANSNADIHLSDVRRTVRERLAERFPRVRVSIALEPPYLRSVTENGKLA